MMNDHVRSRCPSRKSQYATDVNMANKMAACTGPYMRSSRGRNRVWVDCAFYSTQIKENLQSVPFIT